MANDSLTLDQVIAEAKSAEITKQQDQILQSNPTAADLSEINDTNDKTVPEQSWMSQIQVRQNWQR